MTEEELVEARAPEPRTKRVHWIVLAVIALLVASVRWRLTDIPLERDEGEYAYAGQLLLDGVAPYDQAYNMKLPGIYGAYSVVLLLFGATHEGIHTALLVMNVATLVFVFLLARELTDSAAGLCAAATFGITSLTPELHGVFANAEHFVILSATAGLYLLVRGVESQRLRTRIAAGLLLGLAILLKQHGAAFALAGGIYLCLVEWGRTPRDVGSAVKRVGTYAACVVLPFLMTCALLWFAGVFDTFWFWTWEYAQAYASQEEDYAKAADLLYRRVRRIAGAAPVLWVLAAAGVLAFALDARARARWRFLVPFLALSVASIFPGLFFREHYFILLLPAVAVLVALVVAATARLLAGRRALAATIAAVLVGGGSAQSVFAQREFYFVLSPTEASYDVYGMQPFPESLDLAAYLRENTEEGDRIAILGSEPQIAFYADRRLASGYIYTYALMEEHEFALDMQKEMIAEIEAEEPEYLIFVNIPESWLRHPESPMLIWDWFDEYAKDFRMIARYVFARGESRVLEGGPLAESLRGARPDRSVDVYRRKR